MSVSLELLKSVVQGLADKKFTVATAESCTGGLVAKLLTDFSGASTIFLGSVVAYSNHAKSKLLGVAPDLLSAHGAVSEAVAAAMAQNVRQILGADFGLSITGIAGPTGGTANTPIGTVCFGLASQHCLETFSLLQPLERRAFRDFCAEKSLQLLKQSLDNLPRSIL